MRWVGILRRHTCWVFLDDGARPQLNQIDGIAITVRAMRMWKWEEMGKAKGTVREVIGSGVGEPTVVPTPHNGLTALAEACCYVCGQGRVWYWWVVCIEAAR